MRLPPLIASRRAALHALQSMLLAAPLLQPLPMSAKERDPTPQASTGVQARSGVRYIDFRVGNGPTPRYGQLLRFHYTGYTIGGSELNLVDSSYDRGVPYFTKHGNGLTLEGMEEALHTMRAGGRRRVVIPPALGYTGDKGPLPPNPFNRDKLFAAVSAGQPVVYDLELVSFQDDLLDRGEYDQLNVEDVAEIVRSLPPPPPESPPPES